MSATSGENGSASIFSQSIVVDGTRDCRVELVPRVRLRIDVRRSVRTFDSPRILERVLRPPKLDRPPDPSRLTPTHWKLRSSSARMSRRDRFMYRRERARPVMLRIQRGIARIRGLTSRDPPMRTAVTECASSSFSSRGLNAGPKRARRRRKYHTASATIAASPAVPRIVPRMIATLSDADLFESPDPPRPGPGSVLDGRPLVGELMRLPLG
jgi:hypothetical protein